MLTSIAAPVPLVSIFRRTLARAVDGSGSAMTTGSMAGLATSATGALTVTGVRAGAGISSTLTAGVVSVFVTVATALICGGASSGLAAGPASAAPAVLTAGKLMPILFSSATASTPPACAR